MTITVLSAAIAVISIAVFAGLALQQGVISALREQLADHAGGSRRMGIRPNQRPSAGRCRHPGPPVLVEVHDRLDGRPEVVAWLCPDCYDTTHGPLPPGLAAIRATGISIAELDGRFRSTGDLGAC